MFKRIKTIVISLFVILSSIVVSEAAPPYITYYTLYLQNTIDGQDSVSFSNKAQLNSEYASRKSEPTIPTQDDVHIDNKFSLGKLELSGFVDLNFFKGSENTGLSYGQFEIDVTAHIVNNLSFEGALALDEGSFAPGAGYLDYHFSGPEDGHGARGDFYSHSGIHLGQFDVPFGKYYEQIPSTSRYISMVPIVVEKTINCMNTYGIDFYYNTDLLQINTFALNGQDNSLILGGRTGLSFNEILDCGISFLGDFESSNNLNGKMIGFDFSGGYSFYSARAEVLWSDRILEGELNPTSNSFGYYVENEFDISSLMPLPSLLLFRFGSWTEDENMNTDAGEIFHFDTSLNVYLNEQCQVKLEYRSMNQSNAERLPIYGVQLVFNY